MDGRTAGRVGGVWPGAGILGAALLLTLGCNDNSTTGPKTNGLTIDAQELLASGSGCKLKVTFSNRTGADLSGQLGFTLLDATKMAIGTAVVFPTVPDGTHRSATSDFLLADADGHRLVCPEIATVQLDPNGATVPVATS
jgi:hypothetical protein